MACNMKVLVVYHRQAMVVSDRIYTPILAGAAVTASKSKDGRLILESDFLDVMRFRDDAGENISDLNRLINEMSVVYWAWKNYKSLGDPEKIGLVHYRRFFIADESLPLPHYRWLPKSEMYLYNDENEFRTAVSANILERQMDESDVLCSYRYAASDANFGGDLNSCRDRFIQLMKGLKGELYDEMERLVLESRPDFQEEIEHMRTSTDHYVCNMFVMPKEEFFKYCEFVFPILFRLVEMNKTETNVHLMRAPGFISEFLTSLYLSSLVREGRLRVKPMRIACWGISAHGFLRKILRKILPDVVRFKIRKMLGKF